MSAPALALDTPTEPVTVRALGEFDHKIWAPFPGFQERALRAGATEVFLGGAKGPGKTDLLLIRPLSQIHFPSYAAAFVRESFKELQRVIDRAHRIYGQLPAEQRPAWNGEKKRFTFPSRGFVQFGHARTAQELTWTQGGNWAEILYDELGNQPDEGVVETLISEIRCPDPRVRRSFTGSGNPGFAGHPWVKRRYIIPCGRDGKTIAWQEVKLENGQKLFRSKQFIPGRIQDNPVYANDAEYMASLASLPERMRRCLLEGDWDAATGSALDEIDPAVHLVPEFSVPQHWPYLSSFDWGFIHHSVFLYARVSDDGRIFVIDTVKRRLLRDWDLAGAIEELVPQGARTNVHSGTDVFNEGRARDTTESTRSTFAKRGIHLVAARTERVQGYRNMLSYLSWRESAYVPRRQPMVQFFDTPSNRWLLEQLESMVLDPSDPRDVLKVDGHNETGEGGDDGYDALRYLLNARPRKADSGIENIIVDAFSSDMLRAATEQAVKGLDKPKVKRSKGKKRVYF